MCGKVPKPKLIATISTLRHKVLAKSVKCAQCVGMLTERQRKDAVEIGAQWGIDAHEYWKQTVLDRKSLTVDDLPAHGERGPEWESVALESAQLAYEVAREEWFNLMRYSDLRDIPMEDLKSEVFRRTGKLGGRPKKIAPCQHCGKMLPTYLRRRACPGHKAKGA